MENVKAMALRDFTLGKDRIKEGDSFECDAECMAKLKQKGFAGEPVAKKKAAKKKAKEDAKLKAAADKKAARRKKMAAKRNRR